MSRQASTSNDTIFALATAPGRAGVAIVRLSGSRSRSVLERLCGSVGPARYMVVRDIHDRDELIDQALVVWFESGASFTGEEMAEFQVHGGRAVVARLLKALSVIDGLRAAEAGEFTKRALVAGRLDLSQVEGLADLIDAETEAQRKIATGIATGRLSETVRELRALAVHALALLEASIDFADEDDAPADVSHETSETVGKLRKSLETLIAGAAVGERIREGFKVALVGRPNAGKSSLINAIAGRDVAITSEIAGTTRDSIEVSCDLNGLPVTFVDTAGIRVSEDEIESIGVDRALAIAKSADLRLFLSCENVAEIDAQDFRTESDLSIWTKSDLLASQSGVNVSAKTSDGVGELLDGIESILVDRVGNTVGVSRARQTERLLSALSHVVAASAAEVEVQSHELRLAVRDLDEIMGVVGAEEVLGEIFSRFCMGK